jgi:Predicted membrane protein (DUF2306)
VGVVCGVYTVFKTIAKEPAKTSPDTRIYLCSGCVLAVLWIYFTAMALVKAKQKNFKAHRNYMIRSYALTLSAITLRAWKYGITNTMTLPPMDVYRVVAWLGWLGNLAIAEWLIFRQKKISLYKKRDSVNMVKTPL